MDDRLRSLERAAEGGDVPARAALFRERLRLRTVSIRRLALASYLGDEGARLALNAPPPAPDAELRQRVYGLGAWGSDVPRLAISALARFVALARGTAPVDPDGPDELLSLIQAAREVAGGTDADVWALVAAELVPWALASAAPLEQELNDQRVEGL
jgi:hypothetical protein